MKEGEHALLPFQLPPKPQSSILISLQSWAPQMQLNGNGAAAKYAMRGHGGASAVGRVCKCQLS